MVDKINQIMLIKMLGVQDVQLRRPCRPEVITHIKPSRNHHQSPPPTMGKESSMFALTANHPIQHITTTAFEYHIKRFECFNVLPACLCITHVNDARRPQLHCKGQAIFVPIRNGHLTTENSRNLGSKLPYESGTEYQHIVTHLDPSP